MASANDGPRDADVVNPTPMIIATADRVTLTASTQVSSPVAPGDTAWSCCGWRLAIVTKSETRTLTSLTVRNLTIDPLGGSRRSSTRRCANSICTTGAGGPVVASALFAGGRAVFGGLSLDIPAGKERDLVITAAVAGNAADGAVLGADLQDESGVKFCRAHGVARRSSHSTPTAAGPWTAWSRRRSSGRTVSPRRSRRVRGRFRPSSFGCHANGSTTTRSSRSGWSIRATRPRPISPRFGCGATVGNGQFDGGAGDDAGPRPDVVRGRALAEPNRVRTGRPERNHVVRIDHRLGRGRPTRRASRSRSRSMAST
jgi:hypothetical protein